MEIEVRHNVVLAPYTTLKIGGEVAACITIDDAAQLPTAFAYASSQGLKTALLGSGSNVLLLDEGYAGCILLMRTKGIAERVEGDTVYLTVSAGEFLDDVVAYAVARGLWGIENLSAIPGTVGATPVQNVGAYGVEVCDVITAVTVFNTETSSFTSLTREECLFSYRDSLFKKEAGKKYVITEVTFVLSKKPNPQVAYKDLARSFSETKNIELSAIRSCVTSVREQKFPDWTTIGTAGSFFKNPLVTVQQCTKLLEQYPDIPVFESADGYMKISLGYVLDKILHLKGYCEEGVCLYEKQALVLIAGEGVRGRDVKKFAEKIIVMVKNKIDVDVEMEVTEIF